MFARVSTYGIVIAALLMTACSQNETELNTVPEVEPVAITFSVTEPATTRATNGYAGFIDADNQQLKHTGFGVFAGQNDYNKPDLMYNQKVTFTFVAGHNNDGYWSYYPIKYWPIDVTGLYFAAYAPYVESVSDLPVGTTGITGMSSNSDAHPYLGYTLSEKLDETVDLLWTCYKPSELNPISFNMYHALARVAVNVKVKDGNNYIDDDHKVLIRQITLSTDNAVKKGRLQLDADNYDTETIDDKVYTYHYPTWPKENLTIGSRVVKIQNTDNSESYGIIAEEIRYIEGMPYSWQPDGLQNGVASNALCAADHHQAYIYFIPNDIPDNEEDGLTLTCTVYYTKMGRTGEPQNYTSTAATPVVIKPLRGNRTYQLNLEINPTTP